MSKLRWTREEDKAVVEEAARILRHSPMVGMKEALYQAQRVPEVSEERRKHAYTYAYYISLRGRVEALIAEQLAAGIAPEWPRTEKDPAPQVPPPLTAREQELQKQVEELTAQAQALALDSQRLAVELAQARATIARDQSSSKIPGALAEIIAALNAGMRDAGTQIGQSLLEAIKSANITAPVQSQEPPLTARPYVTNNGGPAPEPRPSVAILHEAQRPEPEQEEEDEGEAAKLQAAYAAAHNHGGAAANSDHHEARRDFGNLPQKFHRKKLAIVGLNSAEFKQIHSEFAKHVDLVSANGKGNTKRVADLALQCDAIFTMNKFCAMDIIRAASKGKHFQVQGRVPDLAKMLRTKYMPKLDLESAAHH